MMPETEIAWAAGFWDGEGTCGCYRRRRYSAYDYRNIAARIRQLNPGVLERFARAVGMGKLRGPYFNNRRKNKYADWSIVKLEEIRELRNLLYPFLSNVKRAQFDRAIGAMDAYRAGQKERYVAAARKGVRLGQVPTFEQRSMASKRAWITRRGNMAMQLAEASLR